MKKFSKTTILSLNDGDRFYSANDKSKKTFCLLIDGKNRFKINSSTADRLNNFENCILKSIQVKRDSDVIFLRSSIIPRSQLKLL